MPAVLRYTHSSDKELNAFWELHKRVSLVISERLQEGLALSHCTLLHNPHTPELLLLLFLLSKSNNLTQTPKN